jgi:anti-sigma factor RsiW
VELIDASPELMDHPSADQWIAYHRGELPADQEERFQEHLVRCRDCFDLAEAAASFAQPDAAQDLETAALWRLIRPRLDPSPEPSLPKIREISTGPRRRRGWRERLPTALAASFFVALVGLSAWIVQLRSVMETLQAPRPNAPIADLAAGERLATLASTERSLAASTGALVIHPAERLPSYRLTLLDAATGKQFWSFKMRPDEDLALTIQFPAGIRPGHYRLELSDGSGGGAGKVLETHLLRVTALGRGA